MRFEIEHTGWITGDETESGNTEGHVEREDDIATVSFWYQVGQPVRFTKLPPLAQRLLPNLDIIIEGKAMLPTTRHSAGLLELQKGYDWTAEGQVLFRPASDHPVHFYSKTLQVKDHYLGSLKLATGKHTLKFEYVGRNPFSKGSLLGLDSVRLRERWNKKRKFLSPPVPSLNP
jgi:hypothetical protein